MSESAESGQFNPALLVMAKKGTFKQSTKMTRYLDKNLKRCLEKDEREAIYKVYPQPNAKASAVPNPDKYITDILRINSIKIKMHRAKRSKSLS